MKEILFVAFMITLTNSIFTSDMHKFNMDAKGHDPKIEKKNKAHLLDLSHPDSSIASNFVNSSHMLLLFSATNIRK